MTITPPFEGPPAAADPVAANPAGDEQPARTGTTRRKFILAGAGLGALAIGGTATAAMLRRGPTTPVVAADNRTLVVVTLYGGNDGLNTVAPITDSVYRSSRHGLALDSATAHSLGDGFWFHPSLSKLAGRWTAGQVAIVHGVGSPVHDRSHFSMQDAWQTGDPHDLARTGWIGRWLDATGTDPLRALATTPTLPLLLLGDKVAGSTLLAGNAGKSPLPTGALGNAFAAIMTPGRAGNAGRAAAVGTDVIMVAKRSGDALAPGGTGALDNAAAGELGKQLTSVSSLIRAGLPTKVYATALGGFDTHAEQAPTQERLLGELDAAIDDFFVGLGPNASGVVVLVHSEFGRRVAENGTDGTDHGRASVVLAIGPTVRGGFHGTPSPLNDLDDGDLRVTTDYRSVLSGVLAGVGIDPTIPFHGDIPSPPLVTILR